MKEIYMKKAVIFLILFLFALSTVSCVRVIDQPEPSYDFSADQQGERRSLSTKEINGVEYLLFSDLTAEIIGINEEVNITHLSFPASVNNYTVTVIRDGVFEGSLLETVELPRELVSIGDHAFRSSHLKEITLPDSLVHIGKSCFESCVSLQKVTFGKGLTQISDSAFFSCSSLEEVCLFEGMISIGSEAFADCSSLERVSLPNGIQSIGAYAFWRAGGDDLSFDIPDSVETIGIGAFQDSSWLAGQAGDFVTVGRDILIDCRQKEGSVTLPEGIRYIACEFSSSLSALHLPDSVEGIADGALDNPEKDRIFFDSNSFLEDYFRE